MASQSFVNSLGLILCLVVCSNLLASAQLACPTGYMVLKDRCYLIVDNPNAIQNFENARSFCTSFSVDSYKYDLLIISDYEEFALITGEMQAREDWFITVGAYKEMETSNWYWVDGTPLALDNNLWDCDVHSSSSSSDNTAYLRFLWDAAPNCFNFGNFRLRVDKSTELREFICEGPTLPVSSNLLPSSSELASSNLLPLSAELTCPTDFILLKDRCYFFSYDDLSYQMANFDDARNFCNAFSFGSFNYDLSIISDNEEYALITAELTLKGQGAIVGGYREHNTNNWFWVNGSSLELDNNLWDCNMDAQDDVTVFVYGILQDANCQNFRTFRLRGSISTNPYYFICEGPALSAALLSSYKSRRI